MARSKSQYVCQSCGGVHGRWAGRCDACGAWNTLVEEGKQSGVGGGPISARSRGKPITLSPLAGETEEAQRVVTGINELDRVTGGGFVRGSAFLVGGDPGIGKSTLLMQAAAAIAGQKRRVIYISGEEAIAQIRLRAQRLNVGDADVELAAETNVEDILATLQQGPIPDLLVIDSIQTVWTDRAEAAPGTVTQVRSASQALIRYAKKTGACLVLVGHVTKDGQIAGPRVVEHMVDGVLQFEGDGGHHFRILRTLKNRFGPTDEIGVFDMTGTGLKEVANPSALFLCERNTMAPGAAVFAGIEGTRPVLVEIQALVAESALGTPRRAVVGWDSARLAMVLAVLDARCGVRLGSHDVYLSVAGGYRISEPAADLAVAAALVSSLAGKALPPDRAYFGEIALSGSIRPVPHGPLRMKEAAKLGFTEVVAAPAKDGEQPAKEIARTGFGELRDLVAAIAGGE